MTKASVTQHELHTFITGKQGASALKLCSLLYRRVRVQPSASLDVRECHFLQSENLNSGNTVGDPAPIAFEK